MHCRRDESYLKVNVEETLAHDRDGVSKNERVDHHTLARRGPRMGLQQELRQFLGLVDEWPTIEVPFGHPRRHNRSVQSPIVAMGADNVITKNRGNDAPWDLLLIPGFCINMFIAEHISQIPGLDDENTPSARKPESDRTMLFEGLSQPAIVDFVLAQIAPEAQQ